MKGEKKNLEKIVEIVTMSSFLFFASCATYINGGVRETRRDYAEASSSLYESPKAKIIEKRPSNPDELIKSLQEYENEIINPGLNSEKYQQVINLIMNDIKEKRYDNAEVRIRTLANTLECKNDAYSKDFLKQIKEFTYVKYECISEKKEVKKRPSLNPINQVIAGVLLIGGIIIAPLEALLTDGDLGKQIDSVGRLVSDYALVSDTIKLCDEHYMKIIVNPYSGAERIVDEFVPVQKK